MGTNVQLKESGNESTAQPGVERVSRDCMTGYPGLTIAAKRKTHRVPAVCQDRLLGRDDAFAHGSHRRPGANPPAGRSSAPSGTGGPGYAGACGRRGSRSGRTGWSAGHRARRKGFAGSSGPARGRPSRTDTIPGRVSAARPSRPERPSSRVLPGPPDLPAAARVADAPRLFGQRRHLAQDGGLGLGGSCGSGTWCSASPNGRRTGSPADNRCWAGCSLGTGCRD